MKKKWNVAVIDRARGVVKFVLAASVMLVGVVGCGRDSTVGNVSGRVTYGGEPLPSVTVYFNPDQPGRTSVGYTDEDGEYELLYTPDKDGALIGRHNVAVVDRSGKTRIPAEFTQLKFEVQSGSNEFDIDIPK